MVSFWLVGVFNEFSFQQRVAADPRLKVIADMTANLKVQMRELSHSRILNLLIFDMLTAFGRGGSAMLSVTGNSLGRAVISKMW